MHHAFTSPKPEWIDRFEEDPGNALAYAYDMVCNGNEIGGGSIRIHRRDVQERVFALMGLTEDEAQEKFGFLLDAFAFGAPPHGGIAFGWDRICALLSGTDSIRDVIAFPKSGGGFDPLTGGAGPDHPRAAQGGRRRRRPRPPPALTPHHPQTGPSNNQTVSVDHAVLGILSIAAGQRPKICCRSCNSGDLAGRRRGPARAAPRSRAGGAEVPRGRRRCASAGSRSGKIPKVA